MLIKSYVRTSGIGRPPLPSKRELLNAIFYQLRAGGAWPLLPHDLPLWRTVYKQFEAWREDGTWDRPRRSRDSPPFTARAHGLGVEGPGCGFGLACELAQLLA
ncbi:MAG: transposase [Hymenobacter sp.]|nr:MAG: transposase [Hymenobacter sp.]